MKHPHISLDGQQLSIEDVIRVSASPRIHVKLEAAACDAIDRSRAFVEQLVADQRVVYGVTTGFGNFKHVHIGPEQTEELQRNLIVSHAVGVGAPLSEREARAMMVVRANSLARGYSGIRREVIELLLSMLNASLYPFVPEQGSLGASGDLAPLAHLTMAMMGEGRIREGSEWVSARSVLERHGMAPVVLAAKEGLALTNGTAMMAGIQSWNCARATNLVRVADIVAAMSLEALMGSTVPAHSSVADLRSHPGHAAAAENIRILTASSGVIASHEGCGRVQDSYTLRCVPQVHGAARDALAHVREVLTRELNAVTDNPLIFANEAEVRSAGNFHGAPLALTADYLSIAMTDLASMSERRIAKSIDPSTSEGLPAFLIPEKHAGLSNGFMIPQYTAASLVSDCKTLAHPASVDSIPTSANQEDHVSMGANAVRQCRNIINNVEYVLAVELLTAAQALDFRAPLRAGVGTQAAHDFLRAHVPFLDRDRALSPDIECATELVRGGHLVRSVEQAVGRLR
jgi:histidine ammonia-lyase